MDLISSQFFLEQVHKLSDEAKSTVSNKVILLRQNPFRYKRLTYPGRHLFSIRLSDRRISKRLIYEVRDDTVILWCILDRKNGYSDLRKYLDRSG